MSSFEECSSHYLFLSFFDRHVHIPASLVEIERETSGHEAGSKCTPNKVTSIFSREKHVDKNFSCASFNKDIAK